MARTLTYLLGIVITILVGIYFYLNYCTTCKGPAVEGPAATVPAMVAPLALNPSSYPFQFSDGSYAYKVNDNYNFNVSSSEILMPLSAKVERGIQSLKTFLTGNPGKSFNITGYYKSNETNNSAFPNLGLARANAIKNHFVSQGIPSAQINTKGQLMDSMVPGGNAFKGPVVYSIEGENATEKDDLKALYNQIKADPLVIYFGTSESSIELTPEQREKFADISRYLDKDPNAVCTITGYTDDTSSRVTNMALGQGRADFAKEYLIKNGISGTRIKTSSKGPDNPVASNATEEGRAKNRRTVVTFN